MSAADLAHDGDDDDDDDNERGVKCSVATRILKHAISGIKCTHNYSSAKVSQYNVTG